MPRPRKQLIAIVDDPSGSSLKVSSQRFNEGQVEIWIETKNSGSNRWTGEAIKLDSKHSVEAITYRFNDATTRIFQTVDDLNNGRERVNYSDNHCFFDRARRDARYPSYTAMFYSDKTFGRGIPEYVVNFNTACFDSKETFMNLIEVLLESRYIFD